MKANCLTRALDQWDDNRDEFRLWYNSNHIISIEWKNSPRSIGYLPVEYFGTHHFITSFELDRKHLMLLGEYFNSLSNTQII